jgi:3-deoxy-D-manno-octulosonic-acid transferase
MTTMTDLSAASAVAPWRAALARLAWGLALRLLTPVLLLRLLWRARREPLYGHALVERLGLGAPVPAGAVWLHAVSLGETRAAQPLVDALRAARPGLRLLLTHGTATGRETGAAQLRPGDAQRWLPLDLPGATARFLRRHRPVVGVLMETEVWPALQHAAVCAGVPVFLVNARLSDKSLRRSLRFNALLRPAVASMTGVLAQTPADARRLVLAGALVERVQVCGNLKFDLVPEPALLERGRRWRSALARKRTVVLAASWREGEDEPLLGAWQRWTRRLHEQHGLTDAELPLLVLVPRHPQRFDEVAAAVQAVGLSLARRSLWRRESGAGEGVGKVVGAGSPAAADAACAVWLGDSMREMPAWYALADVCLLGGSWAPLGGQNLIEAAACACPVLMGAHTFNFAAAAEDALAAGAALRCVDLDTALEQAGVWLGLGCGAWSTTSTTSTALTLPELRRAALAYAAAHQGAAQRMAAEILAHLPGEAVVPG